MTHDEYLSRLEEFTDSLEDSAEVLRHAASCALCRKDRRFAEGELSRLDPARRSFTEELLRLGTTAAFLAIVALGVHRISIRSEERSTAEPARYRIVGNTSGVVAYTPSGVIVGGTYEGKGVTR